MLLEYDKDNNTLYGEFLACNVNKLTNKTYLKEDVLNAIAKYQPLIDNHTAFGYIQSPNTNQLKIPSSEDAAVLVQEIHFNANVLNGHFEILSTPQGKLIINLLQKGIRFQTVMVATGKIIHNTVSNLDIIRFNVTPYN